MKIDVEDLRPLFEMRYPDCEFTFHGRGDALICNRKLFLTTGNDRCAFYGKAFEGNGTLMFTTSIINTDYDGVIEHFDLKDKFRGGIL